MARRAKSETAEATGGSSVDTQETWADMTIEDMLDEVDGIIARLDSGEIPLEDSFKIYERGMKLVNGINTRIDKVEKRIIEIEAQSGISGDALYYDEDADYEDDGDDEDDADGAGSSDFDSSDADGGDWTLPFN